MQDTIFKIVSLSWR